MSLLPRPLLIAFLALAATPLAAALPARVKVRLDTTLGPVTLELDARNAPVTTANFLRYVDEKRFVGTAFYRASRVGRSGFGLIQGGTRNAFNRILPPIAHEPTSRTGLRHRLGTISMARERPGTATGDFFITLGAVPSMDAHGRDPGFAAFGRVIDGMATVRNILAQPTSKGSGYEGMKDQMITKPIRILAARRLG